MFFIIGGTVSLIHPIEGIVSHPSDTGGYLPSNRLRSDYEHVSKTRARVYGGMSLFIGIGIGWLALYRRRE